MKNHSSFCNKINFQLIMNGTNSCKREIHKELSVQIFAAVFFLKKQGYNKKIWIFLLNQSFRTFD